MRAAAQDPTLRNTKLIAEPWDIGPGGYQVGAFPPGWAEWNDHFRDTTRDFWRDQAPASAFTSPLCASGNVFNHHGRRPWSSVNFVTAHDGFTLNDVVSYNEKHNEANGEDNNDGSSDNRSWNCGAEGLTDDPGINALRARQVRNMLATLLFAQGTPMLLAGDEFRRSQGGNNNAYCQDDEIAWVDWSLKDTNAALVSFVQKATYLRHTYPILRRNRFLTGDYDQELDVKDVTWIDPSGVEIAYDQWGDKRCFGMRIDGRAQPTGIHRLGLDETLQLVFNPTPDAIDFTMPHTAGGDTWTLLVDTNDEGDTEEFTVKSGESYAAAGRSLQLLKLKTAPRR